MGSWLSNKHSCGGGLGPTRLQGRHGGVAPPAAGWTMGAEYAQEHRLVSLQARSGLQVCEAGLPGMAVDGCADAGCETSGTCAWL